ncbi:hypothetical protein HanRHA438_Chr08g0340821 [Helianthus annuus]|uniref:Uncharacterized protein n=1 Tax=Helianthus annuus TaxID=4232 RepID=A0A251U3U2_HELAN|nr:hypothetical protein HanXRQr2_Chr08g0329521 [Helianthus annuus]KAJ0552813.1 hypothetical protein HanHA89_Chr08g0289351 [Helianthus annuus]KAJ0721745.1 hypothetical protein HanOQP8_Chr08g0278891 [Helianthus annuus]KAJ0829246.1 hypothetical protein HanLR1_Chr00c0021g0693151 [Helianthus annuus]KAJ0896999.1 hypothetical protein HanRHA438_Chr08g0340821 [Helianthus annuus]
MKVYLASLWLQFIHLSFCSELSSDLAHLESVNSECRSFRCTIQVWEVALHRFISPILCKERLNPTHSGSLKTIKEAGLHICTTSFNQPQPQVDKLKDLFLKQQEEIKALKNAIMFLDVMIRAKWEVDSQVT